MPNSRSNQLKTIDSKNLERLYNTQVVWLFGRMSGTEILKTRNKHVSDQTLPDQTRPLIDDWLMINWWLIDDWLMIDWWLINDWLMNYWWLIDYWMMIDWYLIDYLLMIDWWLIDICNILDCTGLDWTFMDWENLWICKGKLSAYSLHRRPFLLDGFLYTITCQPKHTI